VVRPTGQMSQSRRAPLPTGNRCRSAPQVSWSKMPARPPMFHRTRRAIRIGGGRRGQRRHRLGAEERPPLWREQLLMHRREDPQRSADRVPHFLHPSSSKERDPVDDNPQLPTAALRRLLVGDTGRRYSLVESHADPYRRSQPQQGPSALRRPLGPVGASGGCPLRAPSEFRSALAHLLRHTAVPLAALTARPRCRTLSSAPGPI
jgi:hypothetical protein